MPLHIQRAAPGDRLTTVQGRSAVLVRQSHNNGQLRRRIAAHIGQRQTFSDPVVAIPALLPVFARFGSMLEGFGIFGVELQRFALDRSRQARDTQMDTVVSDLGIGGWLHAGLAIAVQGHGLLCPGLEEIFTVGGGAADHGNLQGELAAFGDALHAADQPAGGKMNLHHAGCGSLEVVGDFDRDGQQHGVFIAVIDQRPHPQRMGRGPVNAAGAQARWQLPLQFGRQS